MPARSLYKGVRERLELLSVLAIGFGLQFLYGLTHFNRSGSRRHRNAIAHGYWMQGPFRKFPEIAAALEAEDAAPDAIEMNGHDRRLDALHDALEAAAERKHLADPRDRPFGTTDN